MTGVCLLEAWGNFPSSGSLVIFLGRCHLPFSFGSLGSSSAVSLVLGLPLSWKACGGFPLMLHPFGRACNTRFIRPQVVSGSFRQSWPWIDLFSAQGPKGTTFEPRAEAFERLPPRCSPLCGRPLQLRRVGPPWANLELIMSGF